MTLVFSQYGPLGFPPGFRPGFGPLISALIQFPEISIRFQKIETETNVETKRRKKSGKAVRLLRGRFVYSFHFIAFWQGKATADLRLFTFRRGHCSRAQNAKTTSRPRESAFTSRYTELLANPRFHYPAVATARPTRGPRVRRGCSSPNPTPRVPPRARSTCTRQAPRMS